MSIGAYFGDLPLFIYFKHNLWTFTYTMVKKSQLETYPIKRYKHESPEQNM